MCQAWQALPHTSKWCKLMSSHFETGNSLPLGSTFAVNRPVSTVCPQNGSHWSLEADMSDWSIGWPC